MRWGTVESIPAIYDNDNRNLITSWSSFEKFYHEVQHQRLLHLKKSPIREGEDALYFANKAVERKAYENFLQLNPSYQRDYIRILLDGTYAIIDKKLSDKTYDACVTLLKNVKVKRCEHHSMIL